MRMHGDVLTLSKEDIVEGLLSDYTLLIPSGVRKLRLDTGAQQELASELCLDDLAGEKEVEQS